MDVSLQRCAWIPTHVGTRPVLSEELLARMVICCGDGRGTTPSCPAVQLIGGLFAMVNRILEWERPASR